MIPLIDTTIQNGGNKFRTVLADPPWRFENRTGRGSPEHKRCFHYPTMSLEAIEALVLSLSRIVEDTAHLYLWTPNALLPDALAVMKCWGFVYKTNVVWVHLTRDGKVDRSGRGFYFRQATELLLFGVRGSRRLNNRSTPNVVMSRRLGHSRKPEEVYDLIESCSPGPYLELFARRTRPGWVSWGNEVAEERCLL
jgi:N6-adenosine-specific RNA methylase IME4